ncbi:hypothetical protein HKX48_000666 [Thoreauomyces humboldtii]|nr:hypothetical protein HKX48_000666 [Thoreauomyces humboldtii]
MSIVLALTVRAETPQEHSHDMIVNAVRTVFSSAPQGYPDPSLALSLPAAALAALTTSAAADKNPANLQLHVADVTITNCKKLSAAIRPLCIARALQFRALERNTPTVGGQSDNATAIPVNSELVGIVQHQDPAGGAASSAGNRATELALAKAIVKLGFETQTAVGMALDTATFIMGDVADSTGLGNTCNVRPGTPEATAGGFVFTTNSTVVNPFTGAVYPSGTTLDCATASDLGFVTNNVARRMPEWTPDELIDELTGVGTVGVVLTDGLPPIASVTEAGPFPTDMPVTPALTTAVPIETGSVEVPINEPSADAPTGMEPSIATTTAAASTGTSDMGAGKTTATAVPTKPTPQSFTRGHHSSTVGHHSSGVGHHSSGGHHTRTTDVPADVPANVGVTSVVTTSSSSSAAAPTYTVGHHSSGVGHHSSGIGHHTSGGHRFTTSTSDVAAQSSSTQTSSSAIRKGHHSSGVGHHSSGVGHHSSGVGHHTQAFLAGPVQTDVGLTEATATATATIQAYRARTARKCNPTNVSTRR